MVEHKNLRERVGHSLIIAWETDSWFSTMFFGLMYNNLAYD